MPVPEPVTLPVEGIGEESLVGDLEKGERGAGRRGDWVVVVVCFATGRGVGWDWDVDGVAGIGVG